MSDNFAEYLLDNKNEYDHFLSDIQAIQLTMQSFINDEDKAKKLFEDYGKFKYHRIYNLSTKNQDWIRQFVMLSDDLSDKYKVLQKIQKIKLIRERDGFIPKKNKEKEPVKKPNTIENTSIIEWKVPTDDEIIWKYMKVENFIDMLKPDANPKFNSLYLRRADKFDDELEGVFPEIMMHKLGWLGKYAYKKTYMPFERQGHFLSCWTIRDKEDAKMWETYGRGYDSIAIKTTYGKIKKALEPTQPVNLAQVEYVDHYTTQMDGYYEISALRIKHDIPDLVHEQELRIIKREYNFIDTNDKPKEEDDDWQRNDGKIHIYTPISLDILIDEIRLNPHAPNMKNDVEDALQQFNLGHKEVKKSVLPPY